ncbi:MULTISPECIES: hypothetical protein [Clostridium]|nr:MULTISPECIES: hypothetical protein [Clostridium]PJI09992.1 hypothetical protein CUB90_19900 [Clostridium sp. CT7]
MLVKIVVIVCSVFVLISLLSVIACIRISGKADELENKIKDNINKKPKIK